MPVNITFEASSTPEENMTAVLPVFQDNINEADEVFALDLELLSTGPANIVDLQALNTTLITIIDDDREFNNHPHCMVHAIDTLNSTIQGKNVVTLKCITK